MEELLADLRATSQALGKPTITAQQYDERGQFGSTTVLRKIGTWNEALANAGLRISNRINIPNEELFQNIAEVWTKLGSQPFGRHMSDSTTGSKFSTGTYEKRFETWNKALIAFVAYIETADTTEGDGVESDEICSTPKIKRTGRNINWRLRAKILIRDNCICQMCGASPAKDTEVTLHVDHIEAWADGGETVEENLQALCVPCNIGKSNVL